MQRRDVLKTAGGIGAATAAGGVGALTLTGLGAASDTDFEGVEGEVVETDDGEIEYVGYGGRIHFEWDGLDTEAQYGEVVTESTIDSASGFNNHGAVSGPLGDDPDHSGTDHNGDGEFDHGEENSPDSWGGKNDSNSGTGTDGYFEFRFGQPYGQRDYAIAYDDTEFEHGNPIPTENPWATSHFQADNDNGQNETVVTLRVTCRVYDGDPADDASSVLIEDSDTAQFPIVVNNRPASGTTGGEAHGSVGADES